MRVFIPSVNFFLSLSSPILAFILLSRSSKCISHVLYMWSRIGLTRFFFCLSILSVSVRQQIGRDGWWGVTLGLRVLFILPEAQQPYGGWLTQHHHEGRYLYATMTSARHSSSRTPFCCVHLLRIWLACRYPLSYYPDVYYPPTGVYRCEIGAQVTFRQLTGNGPWHLN